MRRVSAKGIAVPSIGVPEINENYVDAVLKAKGMLDQKASVLAFLEKELAAYWSEKAADEASATPGEVKAYAERLEAVAAQLEPKDQVEATILRAVVSPFEFADRVAKIDEIVALLKSLQAEVGDPQRGSGERLKHRRQLHLAERFWGAFIEKGWRLETSEGSLMAQLLLTVLKAAKEDRGTIKQLLEATRPAANT